MIFRAPLISQLTLACLFLSAASAAEIEPAPKTHVADRADIIDSAAEQELIALLQELEQKTGARIVVLTVQSTNGQEIHQFAFERADKWKLGPNQKSASVLVVVAVKDRKYRFEVGYEWESVLPDGYVGQVGRDYFVPHFKAGRYSQGVFEATAALAQTIAADRGMTLKGMPRLRPMAQPSGLGPILLGFLPILFVLLVGGMLRSRHRNMLFWGLLAGYMIGGRRGYGGGGFGGGGFGGFGGGGGGGFGGGGASGGW